MIIDQFCVFFDDAAAAASMTGNIVNLMPYAGRGEIFITLLAKGPAAANFSVTVQESADGASFTDTASYSLQKPDSLPVVRTLRLPVETRLGKLRLTAAATNEDDNLDGLTLFAAVTRDHFAPYDVGLYIAGGRVQA